MTDVTRPMPNDPPMLRVAFSYLGLRETPGAASNPRVVELYALAGHPEVKNDAVAWCAAFVGACAVKAGIAGSGALTARSYLNWGQPVNTRKRIPRSAVLVFRRGNSAWQGHVCFCLNDDGRVLTVIGGNQGDAVTIARYSKAALIGARVPLTAGNSNVVQLFGSGTAAEVGAHGVGEVSDYLAQGAAALPADSIEDGLSQAQQVALQASAYLKWAQYALVAIGAALAVYGIYRYARAWMKPKPLPELGEGPSIDGELSPPPIVETARPRRPGARKVARRRRTA